MKLIKKYEIHVTRVKLNEELAPYNRLLQASADVAAIGKSLLGHYDEERMIVLLLDGKLRFLGYSEIARGGVSSVSIDQATLFRPAIYSGAGQIALVHNHPTGNVNPSEEDMHFTNRAWEAGKTLGVRVLDHVIVSDSAYFSFLDAGILGTDKK